MTRLRHILAAAAMAAVAVPQSLAVDPSSSHDASVARNLTTFNALVKELEMNYVDTIRPKEAFNSAIAAFLSTVDPYTEYYSAEQRSDLTKLTTGQFDYGGIGSFIMQRDSASFISYPMSVTNCSMPLPLSWVRSVGMRVERKIARFTSQLPSRRNLTLLGREDFITLMLSSAMNES